MYCMPATGPAPMAMSSQSELLAPLTAYVPRLTPAGVIGYSHAGLFESSNVHRTLGFNRLATMPDASVITESWMVPVVIPAVKLVLAKQYDPANSGDASASALTCLARLALTVAVYPGLNVRIR